MPFANDADFDDPLSLMRARGVDPDPARAFVDTAGQPLFYAQTGGILNPERAELDEGTTLYRFGGGGADVPALMAGCWWVDAAAFAKLLSFASQHDIPASTAMRHLALVPPDWSDMTRLVRVRTARPLRAWQGLANSVHIDPGDGLGVKSMPHRNDNPARRMAQLYIPGLWKPGAAQAWLHYGNDYTFSVEDGLRGIFAL